MKSILPFWSLVIWTGFTAACWSVAMIVSALVFGAITVREVGPDHTEIHLDAIPATWWIGPTIGFVWMSGVVALVLWKRSGGAD